MKIPTRIPTVIPTTRSKQEMETPGSTSDYSEGDARYEDVYAMRNPR